MNVRALSLAFISLFALSIASAQIVKWVDEKGVTHYGQKAPDGTKSTEVKIVTPDEATLTAASERLAKIREELLNRNAQKNNGGTAGQAGSPNEIRCAGLRQQLATLEGKSSDLPAAFANEARARINRELDIVCNSAAANNPSKEAECNTALQALLNMENPQSRASANEREAMRNRARASCQ